ncbi:hypothetical protein TNCV_3700321 [Trichonephila clavipes]|nr:hypothetical protein TNCV_3700321 [Trichonephila clavipes]
MEIEKRSPLHFLTIELHGRVTFTSLVTSYRGVYTFAPSSPDRSPTPLVRRSIQPSLLTLSAKRHCVHHLVAITYLVMFSLRRCLSLTLPTVLIHVVCVPCVQLGPNTKGL